MPDSGIQNEPALLVGSLPRGEADSLVRFYTPGHGGLQLAARSLRKPGSKLVGQLQPADELQISAAHARAGAPILTAVSCSREHRLWRNDLNLLALYWFMLECAWLASSDDVSNADGYRLIVNLLRSDPQPAQRYGLASVYCMRVLALHGMLPDLFHDELTGAALEGECLCGPAFEGLRNARDPAHAGLPRHGLLLIDAPRLQRWRSLQSRPLLEYGKLDCDAVDAALLVGFLRVHISGLAGTAVHSAEFLSRQWKLSRYRDLALAD